MQKNLRDPRHDDEDKNENVIAFQPATDGFEFADFEAGQNQIFADEFLPFALKQIAILHHHRDKEMRLEHPNARAEGVVKAVTARFDPEQHPDDREIEKENDVRHLAVENAMVIMAVLLVMAQFVVMSSRCRQTMMRPISPR